jgi:hypothetical protein
MEHAGVVGDSYSLPVDRQTDRRLCLSTGSLWSLMLTFEMFDEHAIKQYA